MTQTTSPEEVLFQLFQEAATGLIECYTQDHFEMDLTVNDDFSGELTAIVGICSDSIQASVSVTGMRNSITSLSHMVPAQVEDWLGELANQLAGRVKNKLNQYGLEAAMSTPMIVNGKDIHVNSSAAFCQRLVSRFSGGELLVQINADFEPNFQFDEVTTDATSVEGSIELF